MRTDQLWSSWHFSSKRHACQPHTAKALLGTSCWWPFFMQYKCLCQTNFSLNNQQLKSNPSTTIDIKLNFSLNTVSEIFLPNPAMKYSLAGSMFKQLTGIWFLAVPMQDLQEHLYAPECVHVSCIHLQSESFALVLRPWGATSTKRRKWTRKTSRYDKGTKIS